MSLDIEGEPLSQVVFDGKFLIMDNGQQDGQPGEVMGRVHQGKGARVDVIKRQKSFTDKVLGVRNSQCELYLAKIYAGLDRQVAANLRRVTEATNNIKYEYKKMQFEQQKTELELKKASDPTLDLEYEEFLIQQMHKYLGFDPHDCCYMDKSVRYPARSTRSDHCHITPTLARARKLLEEHQLRRHHTEPGEVPAPPAGADSRGAASSAAAARRSKAAQASSNGLSTNGLPCMTDDDPPPTDRQRSDTDRNVRFFLTRNDSTEDMFSDKNSQSSSTTSSKSSSKPKPATGQDNVTVKSALRQHQSVANSDVNNGTGNLRRSKPASKIPKPSCSLREPAVSAASGRAPATSAQKSSSSSSSGSLRLAAPPHRLLAADLASSASLNGPGKAASLNGDLDSVGDAQELQRRLSAPTTQVLQAASPDIMANLKQTLLLKRLEETQRMAPYMVLLDKRRRPGQRQDSTRGGMHSDRSLDSSVRGGVSGQWGEDRFLSKSAAVTSKLPLLGDSAGDRLVATARHSMETRSRDQLSIGEHRRQLLGSVSERHVRSRSDTFISTGHGTGRQQQLKSQSSVNWSEQEQQDDEVTARLADYLEKTEGEEAAPRYRRRVSIPTLDTAPPPPDKAPVRPAEAPRAAPSPPPAPRRGIPKYAEQRAKRHTAAYKLQQVVKRLMQQKRKTELLEIEKLRAQSENGGDTEDNRTVSVEVEQ